MPKRKKQKTQHQNTAKNSNGQLSHEEIWDDSALVRSWNDAVAEYEYYHSIHARGEDVDEVLRRAEENEASVVDVEEKEEEEANGVALKPPTDKPDLKEMRDIDWRIADNIVGSVGPVGDESAEEGEIDDDEGDVTTVKQLADANGTSGAEEIHAAAAAAASTAKLDTTVREQAHIVHSKPVQLGPELPPSHIHEGKDPPPAAAAAVTNQATTSADQTLENIKMAYYWAGYYSGLYDGQRQAESSGQVQSRSNETGPS